MNAPALILQLSKLIPQTFWVNYSPGVYFFRLSDLTYSDYDAIFLSGLIANDLQFVNSVVFDSTVLNEVSSIANCQTSQSSFYCSATELWIHSPFDADPYNHKVSIGKAFQFRKGGSNDDELKAFDDTLESVPNISKSISDIFNSQIIFSGGTIGIKNEHGEYDTLLEDEEIIGNKAKQFVKHPETGIWIPAFSGFCQDGDLGNKLSLEIKDDKESLNIPIPQNVFTLADYPYLDEKNVDKPIPLVFGKCKKIEPVCTNETQSTSTFYFLCADTEVGTIHDITTVYVDGISRTFIKDLANNRFSLTSSVYTPGQTVAANVEGYEDSTGACMRNACDILKFLFMYFFGFSDTSDFFDIWDTANAYNIYLYIDEIKKFWEVAEIICRSSFLNLILNDNGSYSAFVNSKTEDYIREIRNYEMIEVGSIGYDSSKLLSSVLIKYNLDHSENIWSQKKRNTGEAAFFERYNQYSYKEFEANLDNETDAIAYGDAILNYFSTVYKPLKIKMDYLEAYDLVLGKNYKIVLTRPRAPELGSWKVKLVSTDIDLNTFQTECVFQLLEKITDDNEMFYFGDCENVLSPSIDSDGSYITIIDHGTWERTNLRKYTGSYSWVLTSENDNNCFVVLQGAASETDMRGMQQGLRYTFEAWIYTTASRIYQAYIILNYYDGSDWKWYAVMSEKINTWHKIKKSFILDSSVTGFYVEPFIAYNATYAPNGTQLFIDNISLKSERL